MPSGKTLQSVVSARARRVVSATGYIMMTNTDTEIEKSVCNSKEVLQ